MGAMARDFYEASPFLLLPIVALMLFIVAFLAVAIRTMALGKDASDERARMVLDTEDSTHE